MEVLSARSALLSNYEVLTLLRELETTQLAQTKVALRVKKEEDERVAAAALAAKKGKGKEVAVPPPPPSSSSTVPQVPIVEASENLRTVEFEAIQYLSAEYQPTARQSATAIARLVKKLAPYDLTKAEKLQIVNLAPTQAVEIYVIVEEIEDRMGDRMEKVLELVQASLSALPASKDDEGANGAARSSRSTAAGADEDGYEWDDEDAEAEVDPDEYDDTGEGAGVEGDLEADDD